MPQTPPNQVLIGLALFLLLWWLALQVLIGLPQLREAEAAYDDFARDLVDEAGAEEST